MESDDPRLLLGVFAPDRVRSIVVITTDGELAVAVRETVPAGVAVVRDARPDDAVEVAAACLPWPWMVVGATDALTPGLASMLRTRPVLTLWLGRSTRGTSRAMRCGFDRHTALLDAIDNACTAKVGGMRLALGQRRRARRWHAAARCNARRAHRRVSARVRVAGSGRSGASMPRSRAPSTGWTTVRDANARIALVRWTRTRGGAMRANPEVLILEDDAETLEGLQSHFTRKRFHPLAARSASRALSLLENNQYSSRPVLAIVDWDLGKAPDQGASSGDVLSRLARELRECPVIVYSQNIDAFNVRSQIQRSHPRALLHDKRDGDASLLERVDRMLDRTVGDLRIHDGTVVVHLPSLDQHHHREAIRLVVHHPDIVTFHSDTSTKAVRQIW